MSVVRRNNVVTQGDGGRPVMIFAHGYGCDQNMWRFVAPAFADDFQIVLFDHVGAGGSVLGAYHETKYSRLEGYAEDIVEIGNELGIRDAVFVGHSVGAMMGVLAAKAAPGMFRSLVMIGPSPYYIDEGDYSGGFTRAQIDELLLSLDMNHLGWSMSMAPVIMGNPDRPELAGELANSFCRTDPAIAKQFARTTFLSDSRETLAEIDLPTLILQCSDDVIAPLSVGDYLHARIPKSTLTVLKATGHCPNLSAPEETVAAIKAFL